MWYTPPHSSTFLTVTHTIIDVEPLERVISSDLQLNMQDLLAGKQLEQCEDTLPLKRPGNRDLQKFLHLCRLQATMLEVYFYFGSCCFLFHPVQHFCPWTSGHILVNRMSWD